MEGGEQSLTVFGAATLRPVPYFKGRSQAHSTQSPFDHAHYSHRHRIVSCPVSPYPL